MKCRQVVGLRIGAPRVQKIAQKGRMRLKSVEIILLLVFRWRALMPNKILEVKGLYKWFPILGGPQKRGSSCSRSEWREF